MEVVIGFFIVVFILVGIFGLVSDTTNALFNRDHNKKANTTTDDGYENYVDGNGDFDEEAWYEANKNKLN